MTAFICAGEAGLVEALVFVGKGGSRVEDEALALIDGLEPGPAGFDLPAHEHPMPEACGQRRGLHFEVVGSWPSTPCARHVWAEAPDEEPLDALWRILP